MAQTIRLHRAGKIVVKPGAMTPGWIRELANRWVRLVVLRIFDIMLGVFTLVVSKFFYMAG